MALEELRVEKEQLKAELERTQGELEEINRASEPAMLTDQEKLLRENPVLTDTIQDSQQYQSLKDENEQLKVLLDQLRESEAAQLRIAYDQVDVTVLVCHLSDIYMTAASRCEYGS